MGRTLGRLGVRRVQAVFRIRRNRRRQATLMARTGPLTLAVGLTPSEGYGTASAEANRSSRRVANDPKHKADRRGESSESSRDHRFRSILQDPVPLQVGQGVSGWVSVRWSMSLWRRVHPTSIQASGAVRLYLPHPGRPRTTTTAESCQQPNIAEPTASRLHSTGKSLTCLSDGDAQSSLHDSV
jgi:hypothetical protein